MSIRTDLAAEAVGGGPLPGATVRTGERRGVPVTEVTLDREAAARLGRAPGRYLTLETAPLGETALLSSAPATVLAEALTSLLPAEGLILVACLGNARVTPDALGPRTAAGILATRHIAGQEGVFRRFRPVAVLTPGVLGQTGIEAAALVQAAVLALSPAAVLVVDALAAESFSRLGRTVQLSGCGLAPGGGVGNRRAALDRESLGVPVASLGIPTVMDCRALFEPLGREAPPEVAGALLTPGDIDLLADRGAALLAHAINRALQPGLTPEEILALH